MSKRALFYNLAVMIALLASLVPAPASAFAPGLKTESHRSAGQDQLPALAGQPGPASIELLLRSGAFDPLAGLPPAPATLSRTLAPGEPGLRLIQFHGPVQDGWYRAIEKAGLEIVTYMPDYGYLVWGSDAQVAALQTTVPLRWTGVYQPFYALHPTLSISAKLPAQVDVVVQVYSHRGVDATIAAILRQASQVNSEPQQVLVYQNLGVRIASSQLEWLAARPEVVNVEPQPVYRLMDEIQGQVMAGNLNATGTQPSGPGYLFWLTNTMGFTSTANAYPIVDVTDDGIDNGTATPLHPDFFTYGNTDLADRLVYNYNWTTDASANGRDGHGNINASIVAGYNDRTGFPYEDTTGSTANYNFGLGINPFGRVAGSKVFCNGGTWCLTGNNYAALIGNTYALGGRISSNSWGAPTSGAYTADEQAYDALVRDAQPGTGAYAGNQPMTVVFSAGNYGPNAGTTSSPGNAKNVITVGAAENYRPTALDGCGIAAAGADSAQDMISFSSRGPATDSRVKPDIVAPGTHIMGAASQELGFDGSGVCGGSPNPPNSYYPSGQTLYTWSSGTSHSAPGISGAASLIYRYYQDHFGGAAPSPAMMKATMINSTRYLTGTGAGGNLPSTSQGFGEIHLGRAFDSVPRTVVDQGYIFGNSGQVYQLQGSVAGTGQPFRVTLAWSDAPGPTTGNAYVNNLDLAVTVGGQTFLGNVFSGGASVSGGASDLRNNVESVFLSAGTSGNFTVVITATNIAGDGVPGNGDPTDQDFALVVYNSVNSFLSGAITDASTSAPIPGAAVQANGTGGVFNAISGPSGVYSLPIPSGVYTVTASAYAHLPSTVTGVVVAMGTTTRNFSLTPASNYVVSGVVTDTHTAWPLYAHITLQGNPFDPPAPTNDLWTDPVSGAYSITLAPGITYTFNVNAWIPGYNASSRTVGPLTANRTENFALSVNGVACNAPGYQSSSTTPFLTENFTPTTTPAGWTVIDNAGTGAVWRFNNPGSRTNLTGGTGNWAMADSDNAGALNMDTELRTPALNLSSVSTARLLFKTDFRYYTLDPAEVADVDVSVNGAAGPWTNVWKKTGDYRGPRTEVVDLTALAAGQSNVMIRFHYYNANFDWWWEIDDVVVESNCSPQAGGLVVGNVSDAMTGASLTGAVVSNDSGRVFTTTTTPDPAVGDAFYTLFSPAGTRTLTATMSGYAPGVAGVAVAAGSTVRRDFALSLPPIAYTWTGNVSTAWNISGNWSPAAVPTGTGAVVIPPAPTGNRWPTVNMNANIYSLTIQSGAFLTVPAGLELAVQRAVINNGSLTQIKTVSGSGPVVFNIQDGLGGITYYGVVITPTANMGNVTVVIQGNQSCTPQTVNRCFDITPTTPQTASIQFFYRAVEENSQTMPSVWHWNSTLHAWEGLASTFGGSGEAKWSRATVTSYSPFSLSNNLPTLVKLMSFGASSGRAVALPLLLFECLLAFGVLVWARRRLG